MTAYKAGSIGELRAHIAAALSELDSPLLEADLLLAHFANKDRSWVHAHANDPVPEELSRAALAACARRKKREPLQYITGVCDFDGLPVTVSPGCLVPRPETELLVERAASVFDGTAFLDWGTGTGCISLALLNRFPHARAVMVEKNPASIACARANLEKFGFAGRATLVESQTPDDVPACEVSLVVSNPPYIPSRVIDGLMPEVSRWEPRLALDGGEDGLTPYAGLFALARRVLRDGGYLCVEYGGNKQTQALRALVPSGFTEAALDRDLAGRDRVLCWKYAKSLL